MRIDVLRGCPPQQVAARTSAPYLEEVLTTAAAAPWYRETWPNSSSPSTDLTQLPILERSTVTKHTDELLTGLVPKPLRRRVTTAGSTGAPVAVWLDRAISLSEWRFMTTQWGVVGFRRGDWRVLLRGRSPTKTSAQPRVSRLRHELRLSTFHLSDETIDSYLAAISRFDNPFFHAFPSSALRFAEICIANDKALPRFKGLLLGSEGITPAQRDTLASIYGCPVFAWYGHTEKVLLGGECKFSRDYHLFPGYGLAEIVDDSGNPIEEPGVLGRLLGTGFLNHSAPLIRYDTGDLAAFAPGECQCGWPGQRLVSIVGRTQDYLMTPSGSQVSIAALNIESELYLGLLQIQYVQDESPSRVVVRIVVADQWTDTNTRALSRALALRLPGCKLEFVRVRSIEMAPSGKTPIVIRSIT
jgi:phenylacetate-CoA ligase